MAPLHRRLLVTVSSLVVLLAVPRPGLAQFEMNVSTWMDAWSDQEYSTLYTVATGYDASWGCNHWDYSGELFISGPHSGYTSGPGLGLGLSVLNSEGGTYEVTVSFQFYCDCVWGYVGFGDWTQAQLQPQCGDERGSIIEEYASRAVNLQPSCSDFTTSAQSTYFVPSEYNKDGYHQWYIARGSLLSGADTVRSSYGSQLIVNGSYRCPDKQCDENCNAIGGGRHMHGDAMDFNSYNDDDIWRNITSAAAMVSGACIEPLNESTNSHAHVDFRPSCPW